MNKYEEVDILCPKCGIVSNSEAWDEQTQNVFGNNCEPVRNVAGNRKPKYDIEEYWYICPMCLEQVDSDELVEIDED